ncbi:MAG TPA: carboxypeptidase regulatory-like domain-containing protein, partial [Blastocatellia bacterium]|nr:carboxypeptidase regulatory-like domain-containing protein [Blastocatellia bacterium]
MRIKRAFRMLRYPAFPLTLMLLALLVPAAARAQSQATTGVIEGIVYDQSNAVVVGATVSVKNKETGFERTATTDDNGRFRAVLLPLGTYTLEVQKQGFAKVVRESIELTVGQTLNFNLTLQPAGATESVTVTSEAPIVETTRAEQSTLVDKRSVENLPINGRDFVGFIKLAPTVSIVQGPDGAEITINGQKGIQNNISVDGSDANNPFFGEQRGGQRPAFTFNLDAVQEVVVTSGGGTAEFGRSSGGFVNVITKSGTNELRGSAHIYGKSDALSGTPSHGGTTFEPDFSQTQFGFTLGGPLKRDRAFFFIAYDQQGYDEVKQKSLPTGTAFDSLRAWMDTAYGGALLGDFG